ncbi:DUF1285 domain-containing protein [Desulfosporosinus sp. SB140]|uniref:DUF1285 domain-containing protein n=1 Tax=Desulfosporosinus paludis TaxID=3115649 RepID=UPI00388E1B03
MDNLHSPQLFIDKDGQWYADSVLMIRKEIITLFASHLKKDGQDKYGIDWKSQWYPVSVEDAPFFVQSLNEEAGQLMIQLYDGRRFPLPPGNIIMKNNIPYISLFWQLDTKLSRPSYNELCKNLIERDDHYFIQYGENEWLVEEKV